MIVGPRRWATAAILLLTLVGSRNLYAQDSGDYGVDHGGWNGLSMFASLARGLGFEVVAEPTVDWDAMGRGDILVLLYPTTTVEAQEVIAFLRGGGRVIIGDDFGRADKIIERLSMLRRHGVGVAADQRYQDFAFAPLAPALLRDHPLAEGIDALTCNHPAVLSETGGHDVVFGFGDNEAIVVAGTVGHGHFVAIADPSIVINRMLEFEGNFRFATNLLRYLGGNDGGRVVLATGNVSFAGEPQPIYDLGGAGNTATERVAGINAALETVNDYFLTEWSMKILAVVVAALIALLAASALPLRSKVDTSGTWTRARPEAESPADFASLVAHFDASSRRTSFAVPAAVVRDGLLERLSELTGVDDPLAQGAGTVVGQRLREIAGEDGVAAYRRLEPRLRSLPGRAQASAHWQPVFVPRRDFDQLVADAERLYRSLGRSPHG